MRARSLRLRLLDPDRGVRIQRVEEVGMDSPPPVLSSNKGRDRGHHYLAVLPPLPAWQQRPSQIDSSCLQHPDPTPSHRTHQIWSDNNNRLRVLRKAIDVRLPSRVSITPVRDPVHGRGRWRCLRYRVDPLSLVHPDYQAQVLVLVCRRCQLYLRRQRNRRD
jgi:hypothetical protein